VKILLPRRIIPAAAGENGQRFFALFRTSDFFRVPPRVLLVPRLAVALTLLRFAAALFLPFPFGLAVVIRPVAISSWRCNDPIMRPSDSAERNSSDSSSRVRSRVGFAGIVFLAIQSPFSRARCPYPRD
jgi:hypothetical protein